jgi:hypothetical protein
MRRRRSAPVVGEAVDRFASERQAHWQQPPGHVREGAVCIDAGRCTAGLLSAMQGDVMCSLLNAPWEHGKTTSNDH